MRIHRVLGALRADRRGSVATFLGISMIPLVAVMGLSIDAARGWLYKSRLSSALDAAALAGGRVYKDTSRDDEIRMIFKANLPDGFMRVQAEPLSIVPDDQARKLTVSASAQIPTTFMRVLGIKTMTVSHSAEVMLDSQNVEVALVLDVTNSMNDPTSDDPKKSKVQALIDAAHELVDVVVQDKQTPFYSKVALVPYSMGVNVGAYADQVRGTVSNGICNSPGCSEYRFRRFSDKTNTKQSISTCVSERIGSDAYTDVAPNIAHVGKSYATPGNANPKNPCLTSTIMPLTSDKAALHASIKKLNAGGSSAGQVGVAWGWYLVSPNFGYLWPTDSQPAPYGAPKLVKVVVLMTDGEYNTVYRNGVIARNSMSGSGSDAYKIDADSDLPEDSYAQSQNLCSAMKAAGVIVYTVGLNVIDTQKARDLVSQCATDAAHVYFPDGGTALKDAFKDIAQKVSKLRLSK